MKTRRSFCPIIQQVENRIVLSFSFNNLLHSIFPGFIKDPKPKTPALVNAKPIDPALHPRAAALQAKLIAARDQAAALHAEAVAARPPAIKPAAAHPRGIHAMKN